jgi:hypothetical protein
MTDIYVLIALLIISLIVVAVLSYKMLRRIACAYVILSIYRALSHTFIPASKLVDDILKRALETTATRIAFQVQKVDRDKVFVILNVLATFGFAEYDLRLDQEIEQMKTPLFQRVETLEALGPTIATPALIRELENHIKHFSMLEYAWRKKFRGNAPEPKLSDFILKQG